jgi:glycerate-2-kinase
VSVALLLVSGIPAGDLIVTGPRCTNVNDVSFARVSE